MLSWLLLQTPLLVNLSFMSKFFFPSQAHRHWALLMWGSPVAILAEEGRLLAGQFKYVAPDRQLCSKATFGIPRPKSIRVVLNHQTIHVHLCLERPVLRVVVLRELSLLNMMLLYYKFDWKSKRSNLIGEALCCTRCRVGQCQPLST